MLLNSQRKFKIAYFGLFNYEEPPISGVRGSGAVFFSGCNLKCVYCQNYKISQRCAEVAASPLGKIVSENVLLDIMAHLQDLGAHNISLITPTPYINFMPQLLERAKKFLRIPIVYNTNALETPQQIEALRNLVDIFLPDLKYFSNDLAQKYSGVAAKNYFARASSAILQMKKCAPADVFNGENIMQRGLIIRHLVLPNSVEDSKRVLDFIAESLGRDTFISVMGQYYPCHNAAHFPEINRRLSRSEYASVCAYAQNLGLISGWYQAAGADDAAYTPAFEGFDF